LTAAGGPLVAGEVVFDPWLSYFDALRFAIEAQEVIGMRMRTLAEGGPAAGLEAQRMIGEKMLAFWATQTAADAALMRGHLFSARKAAMPYKRAVRANHRRLTRARGSAQ
jgi:hypothetical protein